MLASITVDYDGLFDNQEMSTCLQNSERSHSSNIEFGQQSSLSKSPLPSELSGSVHPCKTSSAWSFTDTSCCLAHEVEVAAVSNIASVFCAPVERAGRSNPKRAIQPREVLVRPRSMLEVSSAVAPRLRAKSADFALKGAEGMQCQTGSLRTLEDASSSSFPLDPQRSVSTSTAATESTGIHISVSSLVKKRQEIEEQMIHLQVKLLESFREEWILTGVIPEGFTDLQSQVIASNPKLKTTSFPFTHLLTNSQSELSYNNEIIDKMDCALTTINEACVAFGKPVGSTNGKLNCKDSLTSSFSSVMGDSLSWSQWDETSTRTSDSLGDCAHDEARELISKRLQSLETDCAIVSQLYRAHKQRATETNRPAFRKAYKCNAQKLKEIHREKLALEEQLRVMKLDEQSNATSGLTRSNSLSAQTNANRVFSPFNLSSVVTPPVATLPRRRTLQFPSMSASNTLRLGKLRKRSSLKYTGIEKCATPMVCPQKAGKSVSHVPGPMRVRAPRVTPFSTLFRFPGQQGHVEPGKPEVDDGTGSEMTEAAETVQAIHRIVTPEYHTKCANSSSSDAQSSSDCHSTTPQSSSVVVHPSEASEVCLRRPTDAGLGESSIRCICSCISEHGGNCECTEEINENKGLESDPAPPRRKLLVAMPRKQTRRNLNPLSLLRPRSSKRGSLLNV
ncbi:unnamed protein product [Taenia asiatica]|uniref:PEHE domain-containing protein n=1 Tax=Taenia asiatica TaxID=60517 RepID=A0A158R7U1_TAEAS|nr:unnamed protein product [Taenia asiatica]